jgi:hypothetical protein
VTCSLCRSFHSGPGGGDFKVGDIIGVSFDLSQVRSVLEFYLNGERVSCTPRSASRLISLLQLSSRSWKAPQFAMSRVMCSLQSAVRQPLFACHRDCSRCWVVMCSIAPDDVGSELRASTVGVQAAKQL